MKYAVALCTLTLIAALSGLVCLQGCSLSQDQSVLLAKAAGSATVLTYTVVAKPPQDQLNAIKGALDVTEESLKNYNYEGEFADALPQIEQGITKLNLAPGLDDLADGLAGAIVTGIDLLFSAHPDWKKDGQLAAKLSAAYIEGARGAISNATVKAKAYALSRAVKARKPVTK